MTAVSNEARLDALSKAKIQLMSRADSVFFTTICFSMKHVFDDTVSTACTNTKWIKFNTKFFMDLDVEERIFLLLHETLHAAYLHMLREPSGACPDRWNIACDHAINLQLIARGYKMPKGGCADPKFKGMSAEEIYAILPNNPGKPQMQDLSTEDCDPDVTQRNMQDVLVQASIQSRVAEDKPGTIPGDIQIFLNRLLNPKLPWHRIFQKYLRQYAKDDYSWRKPNRRYFPTVFLPSLYSEKLIDFTVAIDTSGSVSDTDFLRFISETHGVLRMMKPTKLTLIQFDTQIKSVDEIGSVKNLMGVKFTGRGGTCIGPVIQWVNKNKPQLLLVFSDGEFHFYAQDQTKVDTIWVIHDNPEFTAPFGRTIHYDMKD